MFNIDFLLKNTHTHIHEVSVDCNGVHSNWFKNKSSKRNIISILLGNIYLLKVENLNAHVHSVIYVE